MISYKLYYIYSEIGKAKPEPTQLIRNTCPAQMLILIEPNCFKIKIIKILIYGNTCNVKNVSNFE